MGAISQCLVVIVGSAFLAVMLRTQLNVLAGALYQQEMSTSSSERMSPALQQAFLNSSHHFVTAGLARMCRNLESCVMSNLSLPLTARLTLSELEAHLTQLFEMVRGDQNGIFSDPATCFISQEEESTLPAQEKERLAQLLSDSLDVLESEDTLELLVAVCRQGLAHLLDRVADHYSVSPLPFNTNIKASNSTESDSDSGFVSPASVALPLARLLPILTAVLEEEDGEPWLNHLQESPSLQRQAANVYETFSFLATSSNEGDSWTSTLYQAVTSFWTSSMSPDTT